MATKTETLTMPLMHVYHLTADPANDTGYTMEEVTAMMSEHGPEHKIEITVTTPVPSEEDIARSAEEEAARIAESEASAEQPTEPEQLVVDPDA